MASQTQQFHHELGAMREGVEAFSLAHPGVAAELRLSAGHSADPHVEQLLQSFAWLTSALRMDVQAQRHEIPNHLLLSMYPNLIRSIPCMSVLSANVSADAANFVSGYRLEKGRIFTSRGVSSRTGAGMRNRAVECRMQCCYETPLWPFVIDDISLKPKNQFDLPARWSDARAVISIAIRSEGSDPIYEYPLQKLRFHIAERGLRPVLHQLLSENLCGCALRVGDSLIELPAAELTWLGFDEQHNVLPQAPGTHSAHRLLQEYFCFAEKFYFFEISGIEPTELVDEFELLILLDQSDPTLNLNSRSLSFNSFPVINLFSSTFKPIQLDHSRYEYRLLADETQYGQSEVHSIEDVRLLSANGGVSRANPWLGDGAASRNNTHGSDLARDSELRYLTRLAAPLSPDTAGCDTFISLADASLAPAVPVDQTMSVKGQCSNRALPESLRMGNRMRLVGAGPLTDATVVSKPTLFKAARLSGEATVELLSQLQLNHISLFDDHANESAEDTLKKWLSLHSDPVCSSHNRQIAGIVGVQAESSVRRMGPDAWRGHYRGTRLGVTIDELFFDSENPLLLGNVLSYFLALCTTSNHFIQLELISSRREGIWRRWPPRIGEQVLI